MATFGTFVDAVSLKAAELNSMFVRTSNASVLKQSVTLTTSGSNIWFVTNKIVFGYTSLSVTSGTGTASNPFELTLPVTADSGSFRAIGYGRFWDNSASLMYNITMVKSSTTAAQFYTDTGTSLTNRLGVNPALTLGASDVFNLVFAYRSA